MFDFLRFGLSKAKAVDSWQHSDGGRTFGWFIERGSKRIGELEYIRWDDSSQFWHEYKVLWCSPEDAIAEPDDWFTGEKIILRNRRYIDVIVDSFLPGTMRGNNHDIIPIRGAYVSKERFRADAPVQA